MLRLDIIILRLLLPFSLFLVAGVRYNGFSFVYLLFLLACPLLPPPTAVNSTPKIQVFLIFLITSSCIFTLSHPTLHIVLAVAPPYDNALKTCDEIMVAAQIGVQRLNGVLVYRALRLVVPDIFILGVAVMILVYFSRRPQRPCGTFSSLTEHQLNFLSAEGAVEPNALNSNSYERENIPSQHGGPSSKSVSNKKQVNRKLGISFALEFDDRRRKLWRAWAIDTFCTIFTVVLICATGITSPSVTSAVYLLSFLGICTYWACRTKVNPTPFASLRMFLAVYSGIHVCLYYLYQFPFFQSFCKDGDFLARLLGLYYIMQTSCDKPGELLFPRNLRVVDYIAPPLTMLLYYVLVLETRRWLDTKNQVPDFMRNTSNQIASPARWDPNERQSPIESVHDEETHTLKNAIYQSTEDEIRASSESTSTVKLANRASFGSLCNIPTAEHTPNVPGHSKTVPETETHTERIISADSDDVQSLHRGTDDAALLEDELNHNLDEATTCVPEVDTEHANLIDQSSRARFRLGRLIARRLQPHFDVLFGLTPPFLTTMYGTDNSNVRAERPLFLSLHYSAIRNSYILTLIAMMAWAVTYRSWLSFILLLSACILWITPNSRSACLYASPIIVLYGIVLILIQYVFGMNLTRQELPQEVTPDGLQLSELGMQRWENAIGALSLQITYLVCFWLTLRLFVMEHSVIRLTAQLPMDRFYPEKRPNSPSNSLPSSSNMMPGRGPWAGALNPSPDPHRDGSEAHRSHISVSEEFLRGLFNLPSNPTRLGRTAAAWIGVGLPFGTVDNTAYQKFTEVLRSLCVKYWIVVCCLSMLLISIQQPVVTFRIVYMMMLIYFLFVFQISYRFWRRQMLFFWWINVVYSMAVLLCIYTYQFHNSPALWQKFTGLSEEVLKDIGLETFQSAALFERLLTPVVFLVVIILQVHYFHEPFLKRSALDRFRSAQQREIESALSPLHPDQSPERSESTSASLSKLVVRFAKQKVVKKRSEPRNQPFALDFMEDVNSAFQTVVAKVSGWATSLTNCCWRFLEIHWIKVVALAIVLNAVNEVSAPHIISLVLLVICFPFPYLHGFLATIMFFWIGLQILCKMCFQLHVIEGNLTAIVCDTPMNYTKKLNNPAWVGLVKVDDFYSYSLPMGVLLIVCVCWHAIAYRQRQFYSDPRHTRPREGIVFATVTIESMGSDLLNVVKFALNYGFYKFGLELCHCITVVTACLRADAFSVLYLLLMLIFLFSRRDVCARLWLPYLVILAALIPIQYAGCVGLPPDLCWVYPWITDSVDTDNLLQWLFLPGMYGSPTARKLTADFFQFAAVALQYHVFKIEQRPDAASYGGGSNCPVLTNSPPSENERDFVSYKESYLDYMRHAVFYWSYWVSLAIVLATGVTWITLFCLGYMILSFIYLWMGQNVMLRKRINLIKSWNVIIGYNFCVILAKCSLQLVGCVYWSRLANQCWFVQLFGVQCMNPLSWSNFKEPVYDESCITVSSGLHWDVICFLFIVFQRKVFMTRSFGHVVLDLNVQSQFASRGAYLINRKLMLVISEQAAREQRSLEKIREKLDVIQRRQAALGRNTASINEHYIMLRSGDYYLFEGDPEEDDVRLNPSNKDKKPRTDGGKGGGSGRKTDSGTTTTTTTITRGKRSANQNTEEQQFLPHSRSMNVPLEATLSPTVAPSSSATEMQVLSDPTMMDDRVSQPLGRLSTRFDFQQRHLTETLPFVEPSVVGVLANYTDPYSISRPDDDHSRTENANNNPPSISTGRTLGHRRMRSHPEYLRRHFAGPPVFAPSDLPSELELPDHGVAPLSVMPHPLRTIRTSPSQLVDEAHSGRASVRQPARGDNVRRLHKAVDGTAPIVMKRKPYQTHRRLFSASASLTSGGSGLATVTDGSSGRIAKRSITENQPKLDPIAPTVSGLLPGDPHPSTSDAIELRKLPGRKASLPVAKAEGDQSWEDLPSKHVTATGVIADSNPVTFGTNAGAPSVLKPVPSEKMSSRMSSFDRAVEDDIDDEDDAGQDADWDSDEAEDDDDDDDDDANPVNSSASRLNPLQLLNRAMEMGACSTVRHYRRSLFSQAHFSRSRHNIDSTDPTSCSNEDPNLVPIGYTRSKLQPKQKLGSFAGHTHALLGEAIPHDSVGHRHMSLQHIVRPTSGRTLSECPVGSEPHTPAVSSTVPSVFNSESNVSQLNQSNVPIRTWRLKSNKRAHLASLASLEDDDGNDTGTDRTEANADHTTRTGTERSDRRGGRRARDYGPPSISSYFGSAADATVSSTTGSRHQPWAPVDSQEISIELTSLPAAVAAPPPTFRTTSGPRQTADQLVTRSISPTRTVRLRAPCERDVMFVTEDHRSSITSVRSSRSVREDTLSESSSSGRNGPGKSSKDNADGSGGHQREEGCWSKFKASCLIGYMFVISTVDSLIRFLNGLTRQYRRIRSTIDMEKRQVKRRLIANKAMTPEQSRHQLEAAMYEVVSSATENFQSRRRSHIEDKLAISEQPADSGKQVALLEQQQQQQQQPDHQREKAFRQSRSHAFLLLIALGNLAIVYSEWFCYFLLVLNHMRSSTILSLPYPLMVFLWGMLSVPRPTKTFWIFLITYTEVIIVIKYIFQFKFISFNDPIEKPSESAEALWLPRLFGLDKSDHYALFDLIQLISLFLHRGYLKNNGLWRDHTEFAQDLELVVEENRAEQMRRNHRHTADRHRKSLTAKYVSNECGGHASQETENTSNVLIAVSSGPNLRPPIVGSNHRMALVTKSWNPFAKLRRFYWKMTDPRYNKKVDVYIYMFLCEFISFWIMIFGYVSFGPSTGMGDNAFEFIKSNRIPLPFISMLLVQFVFIITDRGLFLQKQVLGKFIFQIIHVVLIHGWLSFVLPHITRSPFNASFAPQLLYLIKCIYFSLSAYQIRSGYPLRILGNFLTKNYNYLNLILFKAYLIVPFLYELRNVMDWMWTHSALSLYHWMELEDIYAKIFVLKCWRRSEIAYPTPRGINRPAGKKALVGGLLLAFFFLCFWGPMALSSFIGATFDFNPPVLCTYSLSFGGFPPIFEFASREGNILKISQNVHSDFTRCHEKDKQTVGFLNNFEAKDVRYITIDGFSGNIWAITPPSHSTLCAKLADPKSDLLIHFHMRCRRQTKEIQTSQTSVEDIFSRSLNLQEKQQLLKVLNGTSPSIVTPVDPDPSLSRTSIDAVVLNEVMPRYVLLKKDQLRAAYAKLGQRQTYVNVSFLIHHDRQRTQSWWELKELDGPKTSDPCFEVLRESVLGSQRGVAKVLSIVTYNERVSDSLFGKVFSNYGIIGMYAAYIFLANRLLRTIYSNISYVICLEELPHVDRILNLCNEIYLVRENNLLRLEEQLVAKLFFLYRSSETMIKWTRHPKHIIEKFTDKTPPPGYPSPPSDPPPQPPLLIVPKSDLARGPEPDDDDDVITVDQPHAPLVTEPNTTRGEQSGSNQHSDRGWIHSPPQSASVMRPRIRRSVVEDDDGNQTRRRSSRVSRNPKSNNPDSLQAELSAQSTDRFTKASR